MGLNPRGHGFFGQEDANSVSLLAVGGDIEDEFCRWGFRLIGKCGALAHEVVLIDVSLSAVVGLQAAHGTIRRHANNINRRRSYSIGQAVSQKQRPARLPFRGGLEPDDQFAPGSGAIHKIVRFRAPAGMGKAQIGSARDRVKLEDQFRSNPFRPGFYQPLATRRSLVEHWLETVERCALEEAEFDSVW